MLILPKFLQRDIISPRVQVSVINSSSFNKKERENHQLLNTAPISKMEWASTNVHQRKFRRQGSTKSEGLLPFTVVLYSVPVNISALSMLNTSLFPKLINFPRKTCVFTVYYGPLFFCLVSDLDSHKIGQLYAFLTTLLSEIFQSATDPLKRDSIDCNSFLLQVYF